MKPFDEIYSLYVNDVFNYLMCLTGDKNLSEELTQETFFKAYKSIDSFKGKCKLSVWLCQIAKNSYYSYYKKEKAKNHGVFDENVISNINIQEDFIKSEDSITLKKILHTLEDPYKEVFTLRLFGGLSYQQISEIFEKSESWVRVTYYRAKEKIKTIYNDKEGLR